MIELIFIYNAKSGIGNAFIDWAHKIISPKTYDCNLCSITYNNLGKEIKWKEFLNNINAHSRFYYIDHVKKLGFVDEKIELPCVYLNKKNEFKLISIEQNIYFVDYLPMKFNFSNSLLIIIISVILSFIISATSVKRFAYFSPMNVMRSK